MDLARPREVHTKMAFLTRVLEVPASSILASPQAFFRRSIMDTIGPRLSFIRDCAHHKAQKYSITTFMRNTDFVRPSSRLNPTADYPTALSVPFPLWSLSVSLDVSLKLCCLKLCC